jgi:hypothetical protein
MTRSEKGFLGAAIFCMLCVVAIAAGASNTIDTLRRENADLKAEITATRAAIDSAAVFAEQHDGRITTSAVSTVDLLRKYMLVRADDSSVPAIAIRIEARNGDYPTKEFLVGPAGFVHDITYNDDGSVISDHAGNWGHFAKWQR